MVSAVTEIYRNCRFRLFPVTEIIPSPFRGGMFSAVISGGDVLGELMKGKQ